MSPRTGRRVGESGTRETIIEAARGRFARHGYDGATIRAIAADAGVDPALVHHFYGTKERLFVETMRFPIVPSEVLPAIVAGDPERLGEAIVRFVLTLWEDARARETALGLLGSAATNGAAARMLREFVSSAILGVVVRATELPDPELRAALVASQVVGLGFVRLAVRLEPVASASVDELAAAVGPTLQRYLTGDIGGAVHVG